MPKLKPDLQASPEINTETPETNPQPINRIEQFLKAKAANQHRPFDKGTAKHGHSAHTKLKERVRRRP